MVRIVLWGALLASFAAVGSAQNLPGRSRSGHGPTFNREIVRIFQDNCQVCHRPGEVAPFSLMTYQNAWLFSDYIKDAVLADYMPPWKPVIGHFANQRGLEQYEKDLIVEWVDRGAPEGDPRDLPEAREFPSGWALGEPDLILEMPVDYLPDGSSNDDYRCFHLPTGLTENRQLRAAAVQPGNRRIVHHVIMFPDAYNQSAALEAQQDDGQPGYTCFGDPGFDTFSGFDDIFRDDAVFLGGWAPGNRPQQMPPGVGQTLTAGGSIALQVHYHPDGTLQTDRTRIGLYFQEEPQEKNLIYLPLVNQDFEIPAGAKDYVVTESFTTPFFLNATVYSLLPHMHLLGQTIQVDLTIAGKTETIIRIDDWDFDWQDTYWLNEPLYVPGGSTVTLTATYDNSADNPKNPNSPPIPVGWGDGTNDEMALTFVGFTLEP